MNNIIRISKSKLPSNSADALEFIYDYFNGFDIDCTELSEYYQLSIRPNLYTYCEDLTQGLNFLGIAENEISQYCVINDNMALCLSENWLPYAFAKMRERDNAKFEKCFFIHIDDHSDLMSPFVDKKDHCYFNMITNEQVDFRNSESLKHAILSGSITIGSMLSAIVYSLSQVYIFHLKQNAPRNECWIRKTTIKDCMFLANRLSVSLDQRKTLEHQGNYFCTSDFSEIKAKIPKNIPCVLHVDMDYFNNRYNASTDWNNCDNIHNPSWSKQKEKIDEIIRYVKTIQSITEIKYVLLGVSPSFYPVEYWNVGLTYLVTELKKIGVGVGESILKRGICIEKRKFKY